MARRRGDPEPSGVRLARSYLALRAGQSAEQQPKRVPRGLRGCVRIPRLDATHLNSPEAHAQYRLGFLARLAASGEPWFILAERTAAPR